MRILKAFFLFIGALGTLTICVGFLVGILDYWKAAPEDLTLFRVNDFSDLSVPTGGNRRWKFLVLGDVQEGLANLNRLIREAMDQDCRFIIQTGDLVKTADEGHYRLNLVTLKKAVQGLPVFVAPGNHDVKKDGGRLFEKFIGPRYQSFVVDSALFVLLDNASRRPDRKQMQWLKRTLESGSMTKHIFLFMHSPIISWPEGPPEKVERKNKKLMNLIRKHSVDAVFMGHWHGYYIDQRDGIQFVVNGQAGDFDWEPGRYLVPSFITEVTIQGDDTLYRKIEIKGQLLALLEGLIKDAFVAQLYPLLAAHRFQSILVLIACMSLCVISITIMGRPRV